MNKFKKIYLTQSEYIEKIFCQNENCSECFGTDHNGEPNGYGCESAERFVDETEIYEEINMGDERQFVAKDESDKIILELEQQKAELIEELERLIELEKLDCNLILDDYK